MNAKLLDKLIEISVALKETNQTGRVFITSFALDKNRIVAIGQNNYLKSHPLTHGYVAHKQSIHYQPRVHAETNLLCKLRKKSVDMGRLIIVNIRVTNENRLGLAAPCTGCSFHLGRAGVRRLFYSTNNQTFETLP